MNFHIKVPVSRFSLKIGRSGKIYLHDIRAGADRRLLRARACALQVSEVLILPTCYMHEVTRMHLKLRFLLHMVLRQAFNILLCHMPNFINWEQPLLNVLRESKNIAYEKYIV